MKRFFRRLRLRSKLYSLTCLMAVVFVGLFGLIYTTYYDKFILKQRQEQLLKAFVQLEKSYDGSIAGSSEALSRLEMQYGLRMMILSSNGYQVKYSSLFPDQISRILLSYRPIDKLRRVFEIMFSAYGSDIVLETNRFAEYDPSRPPGEDNRDYVLFTLRETSTGVEFIGLLGTLPMPDNSREMVLMQLPTPFIKSSNQLTTGFLLLTALGVLPVTLLIFFVFTRKFTQPILEIHQIAEHMAELDFSHRYGGTAEDEVGALGQSINRLSGHLEQTISDLKYSNRLLEEEIAKARHLVEARKALLINVSHELKTPLALIQGYAEGLRINLNNDDESREFYCSVIEEEARHMSNLVGDLLSVSRIEAGATRVDREAFRLEELVEETVARIRPMAQERRIKMDITPPEQTVYADRDMMRQALDNYLSNAYDHTPGGGVIRLSGELVGPYVRVLVFNSGSHIDEQEMPNIWQSFYKLDKARTRSLGGTGIGLSIVKAVMEAHHCDYGVYNTTEGVVFWCDIPLVQTLPAGAAPEEAEGQAPGAGLGPELGSIYLKDEGH
ncbi:MAG: HAMP domain-containing protein [Clostridiales bacterium]|nr:HAMP domain-containing protein [Clostridiales bacterium]